MASTVSGTGRGVARLAAGIVLLAGVIWWVGPDDVLRGLARIRPVWIIPILATAYLGMLISCLRWKVVLEARGIRVSVHLLIFYYTIGYFFSSFLPSMFGGDVARSYIFGRQ
ncbi:MAG TPA: lysylphosphatidylglycerol synthase domain-containing protein, partial [bacterium]|nr:lysylphosphatidylglycerol synthase domain-containing protein [bacterium]